MAASPQPTSPAGRGFGYLYESIITARQAATELESMWDNDASVLSMASAASELEDRLMELRTKLYSIAETIDG